MHLIFQEQPAGGGPRVVPTPVGPIVVTCKYNKRQKWSCCLVRSSPGRVGQLLARPTWPSGSAVALASWRVLHVRVAVGGRRRGGVALVVEQHVVRGRRDVSSEVALARPHAHAHHPGRPVAFQVQVQASVLWVASAADFVRRPEEGTGLFSVYGF